MPGTSSEAPSPSGRSLVQGGTLGREQSVNIGDLQFLCSAFVGQGELRPQGVGEGTVCVPGLLQKPKHI